MTSFDSSAFQLSPITLRYGFIVRIYICRQKISKNEFKNSIFATF